MKQPLLSQTQRFMAIKAPETLNGAGVRFYIARLKFQRELSKAINESAFMLWLGLKLR